MITVSVTILEKFRRFMGRASSKDTEQALIEAMTGKFKPTPETMIGRAFHRMCERPDLTTTKLTKGRYWKIAEGVALPSEVEAYAAKYHKVHHGGVYEVKADKIYRILNRDIRVKGRLDLVEGMRVRDNKIRFNTLEVAEEYIDSLQWRLYLDMLGVDVFYYDIYNVLNYKKPEKPGKDGLLYVDDIQLKRLEPLMCCRYPTMDNDIRYWLTEFMKWAQYRKLMPLLNREEVANELFN